MRAIDIKGGSGPLTSLYLNPDLPTPRPSAGEALVRVRAFGINRMDILQRNGQYPVPPQAPTTLGVEFSGVIESLGPRDEAREGHDHGFKVGDEVFGLAYGGAYAEFIAVSTGMLMRKPASMTHEVAAGIPETWITAIQALTLIAEFSRGKTILWHAGASGVSIAGIQLSHRLGAASVFATAGTPEKCAYITSELGVTRAFNYRTDDWVQGIRDATGRKGVDVIVDFVGADYFQKNLDVAGMDCRIVSLALLSGGKTKEPVDISPLLRKRIRIEGSTLRSREEAYQRRLRDALEGFLPDFESGKLKAVVDVVLPWEEIQKAHEMMEQNKNKGKIICTIS